MVVHAPAQLHGPCSWTLWDSDVGRLTREVAIKRQQLAAQAPPIKVCEFVKCGIGDRSQLPLSPIKSVRSKNPRFDTRTGEPVNSARWGQAPELPSLGSRGEAALSRSTTPMPTTLESVAARSGASSSPSLSLAASSRADSQRPSARLAQWRCQRNVERLQTLKLKASLAATIGDLEEGGRTKVQGVGGGTSRRTGASYSSRRREEASARGKQFNSFVEGTSPAPRNTSHHAWYAPAGVGRLVAEG